MEESTRTTYARSVFLPVFDGNLATLSVGCWSLPASAVWTGPRAVGKILETYRGSVLEVGVVESRLRTL